MTESQVIARLIGAIKEQQFQLAEAGMLRPSSDPMVTGLNAGKWQGLQLAHDSLLAILRDDDEKEKRS